MRIRGLVARTGLVLVVGTWAHTLCLHEWGALATIYKIHHVYSCLQAVERIRSTPCLGSRARSVVHTALQSCPDKLRGRSYNIFFWRCPLECYLLFGVLIWNRLYEPRIVNLPLMSGSSMGARHQNGMLPLAITCIMWSCKCL